MPFFRRTKADVKSKETIYKGSKANGKQKKYGTRVTFKDDTSVTLLTPSGKAEKFADELKTGIRKTNNGLIKRDEFDYPVELSNEQRAYRSGYLAARSDSAKAYKSKKNK